MANGHDYTPEQHRFIKSRYLKTIDTELVAEFNQRFGTNITSDGLRKYRYRRGLKKDNSTRHKNPNYVNPLIGRKLSFIPKTAFKKGETRWRVGNVYHIGDIVKHKSDYAYRIKIRWPNVWEYVHINEWLCYGRDIPDGHVIVYKDGNKENWNIDNLECISAGVNAVMCRHLGHIHDHEVKLMIAKLICESSEAMRELGINT